MSSKNISANLSNTAPSSTKKRHSKRKMAGRALEKAPTSAAQPEADGQDLSPPSALWSDDALGDDEEGEWTPVFPKKWGRKKNASRAASENEAVSGAAVKVVATSPSSIKSSQSTKASPPTAVANEKNVEPSTAAIEPKKSTVVPVLGKNHKRNQKRKNKKRGNVRDRVEQLVEDAECNDHEVKASSTQLHEADDDAASVDEWQDAVATAELDSEPARSSELDETIVTEPKKLLRADSIMGDMPSTPDPCEMSEADQNEDVCAISEDDTDFVSVEETAVSDDEEDRNTRWTTKRSQIIKRKMAAKGAVTVVRFLDLTEVSIMVAAFLAGWYFRAFLTYLLG